MKYSFESGLKSYIAGLIQQKRADGFSYADDEYHLKKLDEFLIDCFPDATTITADIADRWSLIRPTEGESYRSRRITVLRQLSLYILSLGREAYVPRNNGRCPKPVLYIPSREEAAAFFTAVDSWECGNYCGRRTATEYKMLFRLYYCCGLRLSEARLLRKEDVDFDKGILTIYKSKGHKDRLVYLPPDGKQMLAGYVLDIGKAAPNSPWLFPGQDTDKPLSEAAIQRRFKACWYSLDFASNAYKCPTPHCLRYQNLN